MKVSRKIVQLSLISIGLFLILATYFLYPKISENKLHKGEIVKDDSVKTGNEENNIFENVEYNGLYNFDNSFTVKSDEAYIKTEEPNVVYMTNMKVTLHTNDGRIIIITSDKGRYNKVSYDCFFVDNVIANDGETTIFSENLDLLATQDSATVYNNVILTNDKGSLRADKVDYDFETKYYHVSMFDNKKVKIKLIK